MKKNLPILIIALLLVCVGFLALTLHFRPSPTCLGVEIVADKTLSQFTAERQQVNLLDHPILLNGTAVAIDDATQTLYLPQAISSNTSPADLVGQLSTSGDYKLYFEKDSAFDNLAQAMADNHPFTLLVCNDTAYMRYRVIFSPFPILNMTASDSHTENQEEVFSGMFTAFMANGQEENYTIQSTPAEWHIRGNSSLVLPKKSWRLSLKDKDGDKKNLSLAGLGRDDDWILNPMSRDDLKIRERFIGDLWNQLSNEPLLSMSEGEYVELIIDGKYSGLYLLQRRIDRKFLSLNEKDILLKGKNFNNPPSAEYAMEVVHSPAGSCDAYAIATPYFKHSAPGTIDLANYTDIELLINLCYLPDNVKFKNTYYLWKQEGKGFSLHFLLWDVDMSLGFDYKEGVFLNTNLLNEAKILHRQEYDALSSYYPDLDRQMALRWQELRKTQINYEDLENQILSLRSELQSSGALLRDFDTWGGYATGWDTEELLLNFLKGRIEQLDEYFQTILDEE